MKRLALIASFALIASCAGGEQISGERRIVGGVTMTFTVTPSRIEVGQTARLAIRLVNSTGHVEELDFPSGRQHDFWVTDGDREVWRWSDGRLFDQAAGRIEVGPQDSVTVAESWTADEAGTFTAHGNLDADGYRRELRGSLQVGR